MPKVDLNEVNKPGGFGAAWMEKQNLAKEDTLDDLLFNEIIWKAVKGEDSPCRRRCGRRSSCR